jgi:hypothetical protein
MAIQTLTTKLFGELGVIFKSHLILIKNRKNMSITYTQAAIAAVTITGMTATATWNIRNDRLEELNEKVASYENAEEWNIPKVIKDLEVAANYLNNEMVGVLDNKKITDLLIKSEEKREELIVNIEELSNKNAVLIKNLDNDRAELQKKLDNKNEFIAKMFSDASEFNLKVNKSKKYFGSSVVIALNDASSILGNASLTVNNRSYDAKVGSVIDITTEVKSCKLVMNEFIQYSEVNFSFLCQQIIKN